MKSKTWLETKLEQFEDDFDFRMESIIMDITERICEKLEQKNITRAKFADLLSVSPPAVTKILNGNSNFTLKTLLSISDALDLELNIQFKEKEPIAEAASCVAVEMFPDSLSTKKTAKNG